MSSARPSPFASAVRYLRRAFPVSESLPLGVIARSWFPLCLSWLTMSLEGPVISAFIARMANPEINLAAYGGVSFAIVLMFGAPMTMILATSTALCRDWQSYARLRKFVMAMGLAVSVLLLLVALTPLYYFITEILISAPPEIIEPGRIGLIIMLPFPWMVGIRRLQHGVMIRFGQARGVTNSTFVRLGTETVFLLLGYAYGRLPGVVVATLAQAAGVTLETAYSVWRVQPILKYQLKPAEPGEPLTWRGLGAFFTPLAATSIIGFAFQFIGSAGISRMPLPLESLAVWPVSSGLIWLLQSFGIAFNEVMVAMVDRHKALKSLRTFASLLAIGSTLITLLFAATPLAQLWFHKATSLSLPLARMAAFTMWIMLPTPALCAMQSLYQGAILNSRRTRGVTEAMLVSTIFLVICMGAGVAYRGITGLYVGTMAFMLSYTAQVFWLWLRSRPVMQALKVRDGEISVDNSPLLRYP